jgi:hypothetical protein
MTPEELNRTIEFIVQSQARLSAAQEQDRVNRLQAEKKFKAFDRRLAKLFEVQVDLLKSHSDRLNRFEEECLAFHVESQRRHEEAIGRLDHILERLTDRLN